MRATARAHGSPVLSRRRLGQIEPTRELEVAMFSSYPLDALDIAHERGRRLRAEAAAERLRGTSTRRAVALSLRRAADRLDPAPLAGTAAARSR